MTTRTLISITALVGALAVAACTEESPERHLAAAKQHLEKKDSKAALIEIKNALQKNPDLGEARLILANAMMKEGNPVAAEVEFRKALASKVPPVQVVPELARAMMQLGQDKKVVDEFGSTKFGNPAADASLQTTLIAAYASLGKPDQAKAALAAALAADPGYAPAQLISARQKAATGDVDGANATVDAVLAKDPANTDALKFKGDLLMFARKPDEALAMYQKALQADPKYLPAHFAALTVLVQQGKADEAEKQLEQLKQVAPKNPQTRFYEAQLAYLKKDFKRARELATELVQQMPNNALVLQLAGATELQAGTPAQAEIYLSKALQIAPRLALARRLLIATYLRTGQSAKALTALNEVAGKDGSLDPRLYSLAGQVYLQNGDAKKGEEYFAKALKLDPDNARKRTQLAITHLASGKTDEALDELQDIAADDAGITADLALISAHLRRREYDKALAAIDKLEKKQPERPIAANLRGRVLLAKKDTAGARQSFERALTIDPNFFAAAASLAALDVADRKPEDAKKRFEALLAKNPKNGQALLALAQLSAASGGNKDEVAALLNRAVQANPADPTPRLLLIDHYLRHKDNRQALAAAQDAVAAAPNDAQLLLALGRVQQVSGDVNQAVATYGKAVNLQPLSPVPLVRLAEAQLANRDKAAAEQSLRKALETKLDYVDAQRGLIQLNVEAKKYAEANKIARSVQEQRPKEPVGYVFAAEVAIAQKNWDAAATGYRAALQREPAAAIAMRLHAVLLASKKDSEAATFAESWLKEHPRDVLFLTYLAERAAARKNYAGAEKYYLVALAEQPENPVLLNNLAWISGQMGKDKAIGYAEKANMLAPNQPAFMDTLAMLLAKQNDYARAIELQNKALGLQPDNSSIRLNLAKIYIKSGDKARAKAELEKLAKLGDKFPGQPTVGELLKTL
jgi:putative PEP-CTERM system TPR-repeat lipoprotein